MKDDHYWERRRKNNLAAKRSREKRRLNDIVLETKVVELTNENETLKAKLHLMLSRLNMKENEMENLFEEEQRLGHICLKPATSASTILGQHDDDGHSSSDELTNPPPDNAIDLSRTEIKTGNLLTPSPSPSNESLLQILANQMFKTKPQESLLTLASPVETKPNLSLLKRNFNQLQQDNEQAAMTLLSLNKPPSPNEQQVALQSVINGLLRKPNPPKATIDYQMQEENFHHTPIDQWKTLMNYFSMSSTQQSSNPPRGDMMPLKLRMKMLHARS
jgi:vrille protein